MLVDLTYIKKHLRIEDSTEDELLSSYAQAAEDVILKNLNQQADDLFNDYGTIPPAIKNAICMLTGSLYRDREATTTLSITINPNISALIRPYKRIIRTTT